LLHKLFLLAAFLLSAALSANLFLLLKRKRLHAGGFLTGPEVSKWISLDFFDEIAESFFLLFR